MTKQEIRKAFTVKRNQISEAEYDDLCQKLLYQFTKLHLENVKCLHLFLPILTRKEPNTFLIRDWLKTNKSEIKLAYPKTNLANHTMQSFVDDADLQILNNSFGIPEPLTGNSLAPAEIDLMLVPLLSFDRQGYRVGYGKGFYDRFMAQCRADTQFIGISLFGPVDEIVDINEYDMKLNACLTPDQVWQF